MPLRLPHASYLPSARAALLASAGLRASSLHTSTAACVHASGASGSRSGAGHGDTGFAAPWLGGGVPLGAHTPSDSRLHSVSGLYSPLHAQRLRQDDAEDWAFGGGAKSKSGRATGVLDDFSHQVFTVDGASLWDHVGHVRTNAAAQDEQLSAHTYSGPTCSQSVSPFDPTPGVARTTPWGTPAPMESESDIVAQRRAEKQNRPHKTEAK